VIADAFRLAREALIKPFEGYHKRLPNGDCQAYPDPATGGAPWTAGWGSTGPDVTPTTVWTEAQATQALDREVGQKALGILKLSPTLIQADDRKVAALISFAYNCGLGNYRISTLKKRVDAGDWAGAAEEIVKWNKAAGRVMKGLTRRRVAEAAFLKD
jgi:lysozyme